MREDYLWDRSGAPDPEVARLEALLAPLGHRERAVAPARKPWRAMAAAAAVVLAAVSLWRFDTPPGVETGWQVERLEGSARVGAKSAEVSMGLRAGQVLRTAKDSTLMLQDDALGRIDLGPESEIRATSKRQLQLDRGKLHAFIWAPARQFVVDTPSARAIDLGCEYTLDVNPRGDGLLKVALGWVAFQFHGQESFIPGGAQCVTRKLKGPGIPYYEDAPAALAQSVASFERGDATALDGILAAARPRDGLTLWHLLTRVAAKDRGQVFDRFAEVVKLPPEVSRERVLRKDPEMIDLCWDALDLENTGWWRGWERNWDQAPAVRGRAE
jgi:hypothetical protein